MPREKCQMTSMDKRFIPYVRYHLRYHKLGHKNSECIVSRRNVVNLTLISIRRISSIDYIHLVRQQATEKTSI